MKLFGYIAVFEDDDRDDEITILALCTLGKRRSLM
jgi:hypothetical protein